MTCFHELTFSVGDQKPQQPGPGVAHSFAPSPRLPAVREGTGGGVTYMSLPTSWKFSVWHIQKKEELGAGTSKGKYLQISHQAHIASFLVSLIFSPPEGSGPGPPHCVPLTSPGSRLQSACSVPLALSCCSPLWNAFP